MIIVGGRNSSNTKKLLETCRLRCERAYQVETPEDVPQGVFSREDCVAITAGASTPQWLLEQVLDDALPNERDVLLETARAHLGA